MLISLGTGFNSIAVDSGKAAGYELLDWAKYLVKELLNEANLQQKVLMNIIGQRAPGVHSATAELTTTGAAKGVPKLDALNLVTGAMGALKLVTYQRMTVALTRQRLDQLGLHDLDPLKVGEIDAADQIPNLQRLGAAVAKDEVNREAFRKFF